MSAAVPVTPFDQRDQKPASAYVNRVAELAVALANLVSAGEEARTPGGTYTPEELLTLEQVANVLVCSEQKARQWVESYCLVVSIGYMPRVRRADLDAAIRKQARPYTGRRA